LTCDGFLINECLTCHPGFYLHGDGSCQACHTSCETCSGELETECETCLAPKLFFSNKCCTDGCLECTGPLPSECTTCSA
jgi:proprotein convertase subtilisin/kexin type 5